MKNIFFTTILLFLVQWIFTQQLPQFTQYINSPELLNPSAIGLDKNSKITIGGRWQMLGFGSEPRTAFLDGHTSIKRKKKPQFDPGLRLESNTETAETSEKSKIDHFVGGQLILDNYGAFSRTSLSGIYSIGFDLNKDWHALGGLRLGFSNFGFNSSKAQVLNINDPYESYQGGDLEYDSYISGNSNRNSIDLGMGLSLINNNFIFGFAAHQLTQSALDFSTTNTFYDQRIHWNIIMGYTYKSFEMMDIQGMMLVKKMMPAPLSIEVCVKGIFQNGLFTGIHMRNRSSVGLIGGFQIYEKFQLGYSVDLSTNKIRNFVNGGHELILSYRF